jgi:hypothetical protein
MRNDSISYIQYDIHALPHHFDTNHTKPLARHAPLPTAHALVLPLSVITGLYQPPVLPVPMLEAKRYRPQSLVAILVLRAGVF